MMHDNLTIYFDGGCGRYGTVAVALGISKFYTVHRVWFTKKVLTCNYAEYIGLILALDLARIFQEDGEVNEVKIYGDSKLVVSQMNGWWKAKAEHLIPLYQRANTLINNRMDIEWLCREKNLADWDIEPVRTGKMVLHDGVTTWANYVNEIRFKNEWPDLAANLKSPLELVKLMSLDCSSCNCVIHGMFDNDDMNPSMVCPDCGSEMFPHVAQLNDFLKQLL